MTIVLLENGLVLEGSTFQIEDKQVPGIYIDPMGTCKNHIFRIIFFSAHKKKGNIKKTERYPLVN